jgi:hypothetical protein
VGLHYANIATIARYTPMLRPRVLVTRDHVLGPYYALFKSPNNIMEALWVKPRQD